jgi:putative spermidine/putrescine transport system permease protein
MPLRIVAIAMSEQQELLRLARKTRARLLENCQRRLSLPGVYGACLLTFVTALGFYITPALLGGRTDTMISQLIVTVSSDMLDWSLASAVSVLLLLVSLAIVVVYHRVFSIDRLWGGTA